MNLTGFIESTLKPIVFSYKAGGNEVINNGHTVQVNYAVGSFIFIDDIQFNLAQFHFHAPSENHINGRSYPLEAHLVHEDRHGNLAVVAVNSLICALDAVMECFITVQRTPSEQGGVVNEPLKR